MKPSNQIGGKGSVRRKVINKKRRNFAQKKAQEQLHLENKIKRINEYINEIDSDYIELAKDCIDEFTGTIFVWKYNKHRFTIKIPSSQYL